MVLLTPIAIGGIGRATFFGQSQTADRVGTSDAPALRWVATLAPDIYTLLKKNMKTVQDFIIKKGKEFRADLGNYREVKIKGMGDEVHGVRIETGDVWDMDHFIPHGLALDGFVFVRKQRILAEVNADRYDKVDFLFSLGEMPALPMVLPGLDRDRQLFLWLRDERLLVMVFLQKRHESIMGWVEVVEDTCCQVRLVNDELEVAVELYEFAYSKIHVIVVGTHLLQMFDRFIVATGQV